MKLSLRFFESPLLVFWERTVSITFFDAVLVPLLAVKVIEYVPTSFLPGCQEKYPVLESNDAPLGRLAAVIFVLAFDPPESDTLKRAVAPAMIF